MRIEREDFAERGRKAVILHIADFVRLGESGPFLMDVIRQYKDEKLVLEFKDIDYVDSSGIGELIGNLAIAIQNNLKVALLNVTPRIDRLLRLAKVPPNIVFADKKEAVASLYQGSN